MQAPVPTTTDGPIDEWKHGLSGFLFRNSTAVHCLRWRDLLLLSIELNFGIDKVLLTIRSSGFKLTWSIYRFGRLTRAALVKEAKFADWAGFLFSSEFPAVGTCKGRYEVLWKNCRLSLRESACSRARPSLGRIQPHLSEAVRSVCSNQT